MKSQFLGGAYTVESLSAETCVNLVLEPDETGRGMEGFYGAPGLVRRMALDGAGHRGSIVAGGFLWQVVGASIYRIAKGFTATLVGTLPTSTGPVGMAQNGVQIAVADAAGWHVAPLATGVFALVEDSPKTGDISFIDNFAVGANENGTYSWSNVGDFSIVDGLSFASAEGHPDPILRTISDHREALMFGSASIEVFVVTGESDQPFTRTQFVEQGILAPKSAAKEDNSVLFLGANESGQGVVYRMDGYVPRRVSTLALEKAIEGYANPQAATAYTYQQDGHHFYVLCFAEATWAFDLNTGLWSQRAWMQPATGELKAHRAVTHAFFDGLHVVGDRADGRLYTLETTATTDDGDPIYRERVWPQRESENRLVAVTRGELIAAMGVGLNDGAPDAVDPQVWLSWSFNEGLTWSNERARSLGRIGRFNTRAVWWGLGASRTRWYRIRSTAPVRHVWKAFNFEATGGNA